MLCQIHIILAKQKSDFFSSSKYTTHILDWFLKIQFIHSLILEAKYLVVERISGIRFLGTNNNTNTYWEKMLK